MFKKGGDKVRLEAIKRLNILTARQAYALGRENLEYYQELLEERELCFEAIKAYNKENNSPLKEEERHLLELIKVQDESNKQMLERQFDEVKVKLRSIRMSETRGTQYMQTYGYWQEGGVFFDKRGC